MINSNLLKGIISFVKNAILSTNKNNDAKSKTIINKPISEYTDKSKNWYTSKEIDLQHRIMSCILGYSVFSNT